MPEIKEISNKLEPPQDKSTFILFGIFLINSLFSYDFEVEILSVGDERETNIFKYSDTIIKLYETNSPNLDLILIDGRFRVMCALKSLQVIDKDCIVLIDDFLNRKSNHILLYYPTIFVLRLYVSLLYLSHHSSSIIRICCLVSFSTALCVCFL